MEINYLTNYILVSMISDKNSLFSTILLELICIIILIINL